LNPPGSHTKLPPVWLAEGLNRFRSFLLDLNRKLFPGNVVLYEHFQNFWLMPAIYVAAELNIAERLRTGPKTAAQLAAESGADADALYRVLRALANHGIFREKKNRHFELTATARGLLDQEGSLRNMILHHLGRVNRETVWDLLHTVKTGQDAFSHVHGKEVYEYLREHPEEYALFDRSMSNLSEIGLAPLLHQFDFTRFPVIADIGGGEGLLLAHILLVAKKSQGILFDLPEALAKATPYIERFGLSGRMKRAEGNFFDSIPSGADAYLLKNIIHNWDDMKAAEILRNIRNVLPARGRILIIDMVVPGIQVPSLSKMLDIQMLATMRSGRERTQEEFGELLKMAGLRLVKIHPTIAPLSIIEAALPGSF
jgi:SAM-dependent methyltransferase